MDSSNAINKPVNKAVSSEGDARTSTCEPSTIPGENVPPGLQFEPEVQVEACSEAASTAEFPQNSHMESASLPKTGASPASIGQVMGQKTSTGTSRESLHASAQQVIEDVNAKRKQDTQILADFKKALELHVSKTCNAIEGHMFRTYDCQGKLIQSKLQELFATLDRIAQLETELHEFKQALQVLYQEMQHGD